MPTVTLPVTGGGQTLVDSDIAAKLANKRIWWRDGGSHRYAGVYLHGRRLLLHRFVMNAAPGASVDHINGDRLDNRRCNLRIATRSQNMLNVHRPPRSASGYRGVSPCTDRAGWKVRLIVEGRRVVHERCRSRHVGALFIDPILVEQVGPFVGRNFPRDLPRSEVRRFVAGTRGRIFRVVFSRREDGRQREMTCRTGVTRRTKGRCLAFEPADRDLIRVYDVRKAAHRFIPTERVLCLRFAKVNYRVTG